MVVGWGGGEVSPLAETRHSSRERSTGPWLCKSMIHFPLGYLVMGKNVFSWINDMFIQKEVTTLSEALPVPTLHSFLARKRVRHNRDDQE